MPNNERADCNDFFLSLLTLPFWAAPGNLLPLEISRREVLVYSVNIYQALIFVKRYLPISMFTRPTHSKTQGDTHPDLPRDLIYHTLSAVLDCAFLILCKLSSWAWAAKLLCHYALSPSHLPLGEIQSNLPRGLQPLLNDSLSPF